MMQCFSGCFAPDAAASNGFQHQRLKDHHLKQSSSATGAWPLSLEPEVHVLLQPPSTSPFATTGTATASQHTLSSGFEPTYNSSSSRRAAAVPSSSSRSGPISREQLRHEYLLQHGSNIMAASTLQQDLRYFVVPGIGYIAYTMMFNGPEFLNKRTALALSDPVCDPQHYAHIAAAFLQQHPRAMFCQVSGDFALVLQNLGFAVNSMGGDTRLDLATYNFTGYARRGLRSAIASATKDGITVHEVMQPPAGSLGAATAVQTDPAAAAAAAAVAGGAECWGRLAREMQDVNLQWAASKGGRTSDFWFLNRQPIFAPEPGVRKFTARDAAGRLLGYVFFDGVFERGDLVGYYANVTRMLPDAHPGTLNLIIKTFIEHVRAESQLAAPAKKLSMKRSLRKKQAAAAAAAAAAGAPGDASQAPDQDAAPPAAAAAAARPLFLSLGLSPFCQMDNTGFRFSPAVHKGFARFYEHGEGFYPFKSLAAAKAKYGAGLHDGRFEDPAVQYIQAYFCQRRGKAALVATFDFAKLCGIWKHPADAASRLVAHKIKSRLAQRGKPCATALTTSSSSRSGDRSVSSRRSSSKATLKQQQKLAAAAAAAGGEAVTVCPTGGLTGSLIGTAPNPVTPAASDLSMQLARSEGGTELTAQSVSSSAAGCSEITPYYSERSSMDGDYKRISSN